MPSPIGSAEWNTDDDRMSTGHSVHTGSRSETETRVQKPSDRVKEEKETPKISDSDSGSHTTDDDPSSSDSSDSNASSDDSDSDSDGGKCEEISQDELQEIQQVCFYRFFSFEIALTILFYRKLCSTSSQPIQSMTKFWRIFSIIFSKKKKIN